MQNPIRLLLDVWCAQTWLQWRIYKLSQLNKISEFTYVSDRNVIKLEKERNLWRKKDNHLHAWRKKQINPYFRLDVLIQAIYSYDIFL